MLDGTSGAFTGEYPRARYLSQKFVEELCSAAGMTDELLREIERVIFEAHPLAERDGTIDFDELRKLRTNRFTEARVREEDALSDISDRIGAELEKIKIVDLLRRQANDKLKLIEGYTKDRLKLIVKGSEARLKRHSELIAAAEKVRSYLRFFAAKQQSLLAIKDEVGNLRKHVAPEALKKMSERHRAERAQGRGMAILLARLQGRRRFRLLPAI